MINVLQGHGERHKGQVGYTTGKERMRVTTTREAQGTPWAPGNGLQQREARVGMEGKESEKFPFLTFHFNPVQQCPGDLEGS